MPSLFLKKKTDFSYALHAVALAPVFRWNSGYKKYLTSILTYLLWWVRFPFLIFKYTRKYGEVAKKYGAKSIFIQIYEQAYFAIAKRVSSELYYQYSLFIPENKYKASSYLPEHIGAALFKMLNRDKEEIIEDKLNVESQLSLVSLPVLKTNAVVKNHVFTSMSQSGYELLKKDIIVKPNNGLLGENVYFIEYCGDGKYHLLDKIVSEEEVNSFIGKLSESCDYLIQPCLKNHKQLKRFAPKSVSSVRLVTGMWKTGDVDVVRAILKVPAKGQITDNFGGGGFAASIDIQTGVVGAAVGKVILSGVVSKHPDSGEPIKNTIMPFWDDVKQKALLAHKEFPGFVFLGWDIAITDDGPIIIETNGGMGIEILQVPDHLPLGLSIFSKIAKDWLV